MIATSIEAVAGHWSVRDLERHVRERTVGKARTGRTRTPPPSGPSTAGSPEIRAIEDRLRKRLQTDVKLRLAGPDQGHVEVSFYSAEDLERLLDLMGGEA
jgi:ParB family chromosome partitioning protein